MRIGPGVLALAITKKRVVISAILAGMGAAAGAQTLQILTEISPPLQMRDPDGGLAGIGIETVREIQKRIGNRDPIRLVPWAVGYLAAQKEPNVLLVSMARSTQRNALFQWVGPIAESEYELWVRADSALVIHGLGDAKTLRAIGVYADDIRDQYLTRMGFTNLIRSVDNEINAKRIMLGDLDAFAGSSVEVSREARACGYRFADFKKACPLFKLQSYLAFSRGTPAETVNAWQQTLGAMKKDGTFERIFHKYSPDNALPGPADIP